ncbi:ATP-NAD kinase family protein [Halanaerobium hydrogeniformans]|uniref:ATP-NAD/AcoX kinase n=1 Tax=Halanaerobium hydrogeniformans TaxID=656519 RepID=E4RN24_HALHG|nr:ATP-NAD kinase family protein [Halanaerobium hydrogeniformans]ADQ14241.1 ATP-NAD/AcoX kinase [Halanaerobium hydrogeniformans]
MKKVGFIVNPIAGMGGKVALKGTDGKNIVKKAKELGAEQESPQKAEMALKSLKEELKKEAEVELITFPHLMGEELLKNSGLSYQVIGSIEKDNTTAEDTKRAARLMKEKYQVDLLLFAGGDGTARDVYDALNLDLPALGIPAGVKIHSAVYATTPKNAGIIAARFIEGEISATEEAEVMDIDEKEFRKGRVTAKLYGYLKVPVERRLRQNLKSGSADSEERAAEAIAAGIIETMKKDCLYLVGPGTTTRPIMQKLGLEYSLLGVDAVANKELLALDLREADILDLLEQYPEAKIIVTAIGGQGYIFGRGNQQFSEKVLKKVGKKNIIVAATRNKLSALNGPLLIDTPEPALNKKLAGYYKVVIGHQDFMMQKAE